MKDIEKWSLNDFAQHIGKKSQEQMTLKETLKDVQERIKKLRQFEAVLLKAVEK